MMDKVRKMLAEQLNIPVEKVLPESRVIEDLGADSLDVVELIMALEEAFDMEIPDTEAEGIVTVEDAVEYIKNHN